MLGFLIIVFNIFQSKKRPFPQNGFSLEWSLLSVVLNIIGCFNIYATLTSGFGNPLGGQAWGVGYLLDSVEIYLRLLI